MGGRIAVALLGAAIVSTVIAHPGDDATHRDGAGQSGAKVLAPGWEPLNYPPPRPGSYRLPPLGDAADGALLDLSARPTRLYQEMGDGIAVLSFIYTRCSDVNGCPLAIAVLRGLREQLAARPEVTSRVRLITISFDPSYDTPERLAEYSAAHRDARLDWRFLSAASDAALAPLLEAYGQSVIRDLDPAGNLAGTFSHVLRVYLIDRRRRIRNIYTVSYLHGDTLMADVQTLLLEENQEADTPGVQVAASGAAIGPGDDKRGYEHVTYQTRSRRLDARPGRPADLLANAVAPLLGLPPLEVPADNPISRAKIALGRKLFFDRRLSMNGTLSCAMCHVPDQGFTVNELATSVGLEGRRVRRNAPGLLNVGHLSRLFHDARENRLEQQPWLPLLAANEMGNPSIGLVIDLLRALPDYQGLFESAFAGRAAGMETVGMAIASYERTLRSAGSRFDRFRYGGEKDALGEPEKRGLDLFEGKARCGACHLIGEDHALFTDHGLHNTGIGYGRSMALAPASRRLQLAPGVFVDVDPQAAASVDAAIANDLGRYEVTIDPADRWKFKTPGLRNVALTAPYMHDGSLGTLEAVVDFYNRGGISNPLLDPLIRPLQLSDGEAADLVAFLKSLTGNNVDELVADAYAAPIGDPGAR